MNRTKIPWADYTWNPVKGCSAISGGCQNCYAANQARRFHRAWGTPLFYPGIVEEVRAKVTRKWMAKHGRQRIFACSVSDLFHNDLDPAARMQVLQMANAFSCFHTFIFLTKRAKNMEEELWRWHNENHMCGQWPHVWAGVSAENQKWADERVPHLRSLKWLTRFVSVEPMLGPVDLSRWLSEGTIRWVIAGQETGSKKRPFDNEWIDGKYGIDAQCKTYGIPFFDKRPTWARREWPR